MTQRAAGRHWPAGPSTAWDRGALTITVSANGTLQPTYQVEVGSELSGTVASVAVDVNDRLQRGQVLAALDTAKLRDQVTASRAALAAARAAVQQAEATVTEARAPMPTKPARAPAWPRRRPRSAPTETSLAKASIRWPISGVVLARAVDPGNAVATAA